MIELWVPGDPIPQGRPRFARIGNGVRTYDPKKSTDWKQFIALRAASEGVKPYAQGVPLAMDVVFQLVRPASISAKKRPYPTCKPDLDNLLKAVKDGLKGIAWHDDSQVVSVMMRKVYRDISGVHIMITEVL